MDTAELVRQLFLILLGNGMCLILLDRKYSLNKTVCIYGIVTAAVVILGLSIHALFGKEIFLSLYPVIINSTTLAALFYLSKRKGLSVVFTMLTVIVISTLIALPLSYLARTTGQPVWIEILLKTLISIPIIFILYRYLRPSYLKMLTVIKKGWGNLCLIPGLYYMLTLPNIVRYHTTPAENWKAFVTCMLALFIVIVSYGVIFILLAQTIHETELREEEKLLKIQVQAMEQHVEILKKNEEKLQIYRHDLRHYIAQINVLIESGNTEEALHILDSIKLLERS